jgi:hypothetical protein
VKSLNLEQAVLSYPASADPWSPRFWGASRPEPSL